MASAKLSLVRSIMEAWGRGDFRSADWAHPEIEYVIPDGPAQGAWTGVDGMAQGFSEFIDAWENLTIKVHEYIELDEERVLLFAQQFGRGKASGVELSEMHPRGGAAVFHVRDGQVTRVVIYYDRDRAIADLGI